MSQKELSFEWELIADGGYASRSKTYRTKVFGGWLVRAINQEFVTEHWNKHGICDNGTRNKQTSVSESMIFFPDPNHEWTIKKPKGIFACEYCRAEAESSEEIKHCQDCLLKERL